MPVTNADPSRRLPGRVPSLLIVVLAALVLSLLLNVPVVREEPGWTIVPVALETVLLLTAMAWLPRLRAGRSGAVVAAGIAVVATLIVILQLSDLALRIVLGRPLNPYLDVQLLSPISDLLTGMLGTVLGWLAVAALAAAPLLLAAPLYALLRGVQRSLHEPLVRRVTVGGCAACIAWYAIGQPLTAQPGQGQLAFGMVSIGGLAGEVVIERHRLVAGRASDGVVGYVRAARQTIDGIAEIRRAIASDRFEAVPATTLLRGLGGADVVLVFFESYGRSAIELPRYAPIPATLKAFEERLSSRGLVSASAWLTSPTVGGQSWLANGTFVSGLWLPDQGRYDAAMQSQRLTFARAFARAGYRTVAVKPAIIHPWPEGTRQGFSQVYAAADLGYAGKPFNWITMPDQYTLSALQKAEPRSPSRPLFAEVSLISSHSPWTPIPPVLDWNAVGDGRVFSQWAESGYSPDDVWADIGLMQQQYGLSVDYVLQVLTGYAERFVDRRTLLIVVGDHQPPVFISGDGAGADVPIHIISGDPHLLEPFLKAGFTSGMRPAPDVAPTRMDTVRDFFFEAFSDNAQCTMHNLKCADPATHAD